MSTVNVNGISYVNNPFFNAVQVVGFGLYMEVRYDTYKGMLNTLEGNVPVRPALKRMAINAFHDTRACIVNHGNAEAIEGVMWGGWKNQYPYARHGWMVDVLDADDTTLKAHMGVYEGTQYHATDCVNEDERFVAYPATAANEWIRRYPNGSNDEVADQFAKWNAVEFAALPPREDLFQKYEKVVRWNDWADGKAVIIEQTSGYAPRRWIEKGENNTYVLAHRIGLDTAGMMMGDGPHHVEREAISYYKTEQLLKNAARWA